MPLDPNICKKLLEVIKPSNIDSFNLTESKKKFGNNVEEMNNWNNIG